MIFYNARKNFKGNFAVKLNRCMKTLHFALLFSIGLLIPYVSFAQTHQNHQPMKHFSLLVRVPLSYSTEIAAKAFPQWQALIDDWKAKGIYVFSFAFPGEGYTVTGSAKNIKKESVLSDNRRVVSQVVIRAENIDQAVKLAQDIPVLPYDGAVEVREIPQPLTLVKE